MKITRIYLKNLNSLRGEFTIDFEKEPFCNAGIFAITGPTGAGKSTILDAITLALYGRAARYDKKPNPENMMSRAAGECQAEVVFEVPQGRFRASWQLNRARGNPGGKLQPVQRFVYDSHGQALAQNVTEADKLIEELTGLDVDRFFRSALLAQGDFVKFLKTTPDDRAKLLESLTGTEIYSEISIRAHDETTKRANELKLKEKGLENTKLLSDEEHASLVNQITEYKYEIENNTLKLTKQGELITQGTNLVKYLKDETELKEQLQVITKESIDFEADFKRLNVWRKGFLFFPELRDLDQMSKCCDDKKNDVERAEYVLATTKSELRAGVDATSEMIVKQITDIEKTMSDATATRSEKSTELDTRNKWLEDHAQDQTLDVNLSLIIEQITSLAHHRKKAEDASRTQSGFRKALDNAQNNLSSFLANHKEALSKLKDISCSIETNEEVRLALLQNQTVEQVQQEITKLDKHVSYLNKKQENLEALKNIEKEINEHNDDIQQLTSKCANAKKATADEENALRFEQEKIKILTNKRDENRLIASLHEHREKLEHGKSCPLCGSLDHPFVGTLESSVRELSDLEKEIKNLEESSTKRSCESRNLLTISAKAEAALINKMEELEKTTSNSKSIRSTLKNLAQAYGLADEQNFESISDIEKEKVTANEKLVNARSLVESIQAIVQKKNELQESLAKVQHTIDLINQKINSEQEKIQATERDISANKITIDDTQTEITKLESSLLEYLGHYGLAVPPFNEEKRLRDTLEQRKNAYRENLKLSIELKNELNTLSTSSRDLEQRAKGLESKNDKLRQFSESHEIQSINYNSQKKIELIALWNTIDEADECLKRLAETLIKAQSALDGYKKEVSKAQSTYSEADIKLSNALCETEFKNIGGLRAAQLTSDEVDRIQTKEEEIKTRSNKVRGQLTQVQNEIASLMHISAPQGDQLLEMQIQRTELTKQTDDMRGRLAVSESRLLKDEENHILHAALFKELEVDRKRLSVWQKISNLIGSHNGTAFRKFAQGLSLDLLLKHANKHLTLLSNRYRLKRTFGDLLDLEIQDLHQANATRPTASLSGGESFLTSLALALGLSDLAGKNVKIDSLFIDEGFGSLDPETLEVAVQALESLRSKNKTIGVISHIELLKERISTQIIIEKVTGGVSTMSFSA